jgi:hypothetical protein
MNDDRGTIAAELAGPAGATDRAAGSPRGWWLALIAIVVAVYGALALWPDTMRFFGVGTGGRWFRDARTVLAGSDAARLGIDTTTSNPLDADGAFFDYPRTWYVLGRLGLTREDSIWVGLLIVVAAFGALAALVRPRRAGEMLAALGIACSPPLWLAFNRANADLLLFALLAPVAGLLFVRRAGGAALAVALVALATSLKFYPALAAVVFLAPDRARRAWWWRLAAVAVVLGALAWWLAADARRFQGQGWLPHGLFTFGAAALPMNFGVPAAEAIRAGAFTGAAMFALALLWSPLRGWMAAPEEAREKTLFALGATLLTGCFFSVINFEYRFVFALFLLPLAWRTAGRGDAPRLAAELLRGLVLLAVVLCWSDGLACALVNFLGPGVERATAIALRRNVGLAGAVLAWGWVAMLAIFVADFVRGSVVRVVRGQAGE